MTHNVENFSEIPSQQTPQ